MKGDCDDYYDPPYAGLNQQLGEKVAAYNRLRDTLADKYPILERNADLESSSYDLRTIANKGPSAEVAGLLGEQISDTLSKIKRSRDGLDTGDVNLWRLPKIIDLTRLAMQTDAEPWQKRVIDDTVADNQPGIWQSIALAVPTTHLPVSNGNWEGKVGESEWLSTDPRVNAVTSYEGIPYRRGYPDFRRWSRGEVAIRQSTNRSADFAAADRLFAQQQSRLHTGTPNPWLHNGQPNGAAAARFRDANRLTWHHHQDGRTMQLIPMGLHGNVPHSGGVSGL